MTYELAKVLEDAGFLQPPAWSELNGGPYAPKLDELIEACGDEFTVLQNFAAKGWGAYALREYRTENNNRRTKELSELGSTPEEAVAHLWLQLNKGNATIG